MSVGRDTIYHGAPAETSSTRDNDTSTGDAPGESLLTRLRIMVLDDAFPPGTALSEVRLAEHFSISRTPVREALKQLQAEGLVEIRPKVGTFVRQISRREISEMFEVKEVLEGMAARLLARRGQVLELDILQRNVRESDIAARAGDEARYAALVHEFHQTIVEGSDNRKLVEHYTSLMNQLSYHRMVLTNVKKPGRLTKSNHEHHRILELITDKDGVGAELAMRDHVLASARTLMENTTNKQHI